MTPLAIPPLTTDRLTLRGFEARDYPAYRAYYTGPRTSGVGGPLPVAQVFQRFCAMIGHWQMRGFGRFAITLTGEDVAFGHAGPMQHGDGETEMTWTLWDGAREGFGYATEAAGATLQHFFSNGRETILAFIEADNAASLRVAERLGAVADPKGATPDYMRDGRRFILANGSAP